jgi:hypothetical protein
MKEQWSDGDRRHSNAVALAACGWKDVRVGGGGVEDVCVYEERGSAL